MIEISEDNRILKYFTALLLLLPNLHFWSSVIGKEALLLPFLVLIIFEVHRKRYFSLFIFVALFFIALVRPHVAFVLLLSYTLSLLLVIKSSIKYKMILIGGFGLCAILFSVLLVRIQNFDGGFQRVLKKYDAHIQYFKSTDAYVPLDQYGISMKIFTFYFRPLPLEKAGLRYGIISFENAVLLLLSLVTAYYSLKFFKILYTQILFIFPAILLLLLALMYVFAYANFGIIMRAKMMVLPFLFVLILTVMSTAVSHQKLNRHKSNHI
ncbi:hypothetical protein [Chryseobacterium caseinilyticum]|uniref:O-antigen ligase domain-containing protein n=1 Tax=Chryseobacterium caseinilyticum TaxID=2771428 RepID=A0ABR8ZH27_9FLAO|nr:hypothetical protein [Chryseobacterium caseinilyticum]MBD8084621.1 hypothetical protein [Chryseobacterium caseinilyticum]